MRGEVLAWRGTGLEGEAATQEPWVFEDIFLSADATQGVPSRVMVRIEVELLGFIVEEHSWARQHRTWRTRKSYTATRSEAVVEAGRIVHSWLSRGYSIDRP